MKRGLVIRSTGSWYEVKDSDSGTVWKGRLRGKLKIREVKATNPIAVGDYVQFEVEDAENGTVLIHDLEERRNYIIRQSTHKKAHRHIIAANIDLALVMATLKRPRTSTGFIDRYLVSAESFEVPALVLFNKQDLLDEAEAEQQASLIALYRSLGYECLSISALKNEGIGALKEKMLGKTTLIAGHSGVGKSTLINQLVPEATQATQEISSFANKGVHTTTFAEMFALDHSSFLIDTPGIKELGIMGLEENEVGMFFPEIRAAREACKFYNCTHIHEPGCAVIEAVKLGEIHPSRYKSYVSIFANEDNRR